MAVGVRHSLRRGILCWRLERGAYPTGGAGGDSVCDREGGPSPEQYKPLELPATTRCPPELTLPRRMLHDLLAARARHGDYADCHERLHHVDAQTLCSCGRRKAPDHIFYCRKIPPRWRIRLGTRPSATMHRALGENFTEFTKVARDSAFFEKVCRRY